MKSIQNFGIAVRLALGFSFLILLMARPEHLFNGQGRRDQQQSPNDQRRQQRSSNRFAINFRGSVHDRAIAIRDVTLVTSAE